MIPVLAALAQEVPVPVTTTEAAGAAELTFPTIDWVALLPILVLGLGGILLLTLVSLLRRRLPEGVASLWAIVVAAAAMITVVPLWARVQGWDHVLWWDLDTAGSGPFSTVGSPCQGPVGPSCGAVGIDGFALAIILMICAAVILTALAADGYLRREGLAAPEFYALLLLSATGGAVMATANDLIVLFLGYETLSIAVYVLAAMNLRRAQSQESGLKYFILGGFSSAFLLYGIAMVYGATGTTNLVAIRNLLSERVLAPLPTQELFGGWNPELTLTDPLLLLGVALLLVGLAFKVAAVPFHTWAADVYDGAPTPVVAFMAGAVKAAGFAALVRVLLVGLPTLEADWQPIIAVLAALTMVVGSFLAIVQTNVKRLLAYSSISHAGFILVALQAPGLEGSTALVFYLAAYVFLVAGSFTVATIVARGGDRRVWLDDYRGLGYQRPALALGFTVLLLGQAGIPFTSGFVAKLYVIIAAVGSDSTWLAIVAAVTSVVSAYLYLRLVVTMWMRRPDEAVATARPRLPMAARVGLVLCVVATLFIGILPDPLTRFAEQSTPVAVEVAPETPGLPAGVELPGFEVGGPP